MQPQSVARAAALAGLIAAGLGWGGCGSPVGASPSTPRPAREIVVTGMDTMRFTPETFTVAPAEAVTITFKNAGVVPHDLVTQGADENLHLVRVAGGTETRGTFQATRPGTYLFICTQPGHQAAGMLGRITVG
jgi:plastocyanin